MRQARTPRGWIAATEDDRGALDGEIEPRKVEAFAQRKSDLQESITRLQNAVDTLKATPRHIPFKDLPEGARFDRLSTHSKHLIDTIKMVAYRAETAMVQIVRQKLTRHDDARSLRRAIGSTEIDLLPDLQAKTLTICLHPLANPSSDQAVGHLQAAAEIVFPGIDLRLIYESVSPQSP